MSRSRHGQFSFWPLVYFQLTYCGCRMKEFIIALSYIASEYSAGGPLMKLDEGRLLR